MTLLILVLMTWPEVREGIATEYYACLLIAGAGASFVGRANDLITLFLSLELLSIPTYVLLYLPVRTHLNQEAAAKYFLLSVMSSAILLFGFSYLYGLAGSTNISAITAALTNAHAGINDHPNVLSPMALLGIVLVTAALGFRVTMVPFHFYAPDVYQGGPTGVVAQLAVLPKIAGFTALGRLLGMFGSHALHLPFEAATQFPLLLWILAILTMTVGNVLALLQDNLKRMLAYSSVAHAGYMLMGLIVASSLPETLGTPRIDPANEKVLGVVGPTVGGIDALLVYLVAYALMTLGAFAIILYLSSSERPVESIDDLAGIGRSHPLPAAAMAIFLFSLIGMPLTAGFAGKLLLFMGAFTAPSGTGEMGNLYRVLAVVAAVNSAIGAYYYLRVIGVMFLRSPLRPLPGSQAIPALLAAVVLALATLFFGIYPEPLARAARKAAPVPILPFDPPADRK
jgi:NADH-quinone oxidoreductase subunit N